MVRIKTDIKVVYNNFDVTSQIEERIISIDFIDNISAFADSISIQIHNVDGFFLSNVNRPLKGHILEVQIGDLICGAFELDEPEYFLYPENRIVLKGQSAKVSSSKMLSKINRYYEGVSLFSIIKEMGDILRLKTFLFCDDVRINRASFFNKTPMQIVANFCEKYGYNYKITNRTDNFGFKKKDKLIISDKLDNRIQTQASELIISKKNRTNLDSLNITDKSKNYTRKRVYVRNPNNRKLNNFFETNFDSNLNNSVEDTVTFQGDFSGSEMARIAKTLQRQEKLVGEFSMKGTSKALAGALLRIQNFSEFLDGKYIIKKAVHRFGAGSGWKVSGEFYNAN